MVPCWLLSWLCPGSTNQVTCINTPWACPGGKSSLIAPKSKLEALYCVAEIPQSARRPALGLLLQRAGSRGVYSWCLLCSTVMFHSCIRVALPHCCDSFAATLSAFFLQIGIALLRRHGATLRLHGATITRQSRHAVL
jgi:hypothetical protein